MTIFQSIILGIIQGLTEFLPISSSAHLVIVPYLLGWNIPDQAEFIFDVLVQIGTLLAVIVYFRKDIIKIIQGFIGGLIRKHPFDDPNSKLGWFLIIASIPAVIFGILLKDYIEQAFSSPIATALLLLVTAVFLVIAEKFGTKTKDLTALNWLDALIIGGFQVVSLFPGVSRSGSTITGGMLCKLERSAAARFSFLMSIPVMIGAGGLALIDLIQLPNVITQTIPLIAGFLTSSIIGYLSIHWLLGFLNKRPLVVFSVYCAVISLTVLIVALVRNG